MNPSKNEGIVMSGGAINAGALAVGRDAQAVQNQGAGGDRIAVLTARLDELARLIEAHRPTLEDAPGLVRSVEVVKQEIARDRPSRITVQGTLDGIAAAVKSVAAIGGSVQAIQALVKQLF